MAFFWQRCTTFIGFVFSIYCCYCLYLGFTRYWLSTFNKLQSEFHVYHFFPHFSYALFFPLFVYKVPGYQAFTIRLWRACGRTFQQFLPTARLLARSRPTTVVSNVGNLGLVVSQRLLTSQLKKNT